MAEVYVWPQEMRPTDEAGHHGSLHAKCAVADDEYLFVSSANLTGYALTLNMELGLLVRGGPAPRTITAHFARLIGHGVLQPVAGPQRAQQHCSLLLATSAPILPPRWQPHNIGASRAR